MTLRTITFDDSIYKLVPLEPTELMINDGEVFASNATLCYMDMIAAAPEYQEPEKKFNTSILEKGKIYEHIYLGNMEYLGTDTYFGDFTFMFYHFRDKQTRYFKPDRVESEFITS